MGAVKGYTFPQLRAFVLSLQKTGFNGDLCLIYRDLSGDTLQELRKLNVILVPMQYRGGGALNSWSRFWKLIKPVMTVLGKSGIGRLIMKNITPLQTSRFYNYNDFLRRNRTKYKNVLISDVRDVIFQGDPFVKFSAAKVQCYEEDRDISEDTHFNLPWISALFGDHAADRLRSSRIVCSGTIMGPVEEMIAYIDQMEGLLIDSKDIGIGGSDQGLHNYLLRTQKHNADIIPNGRGDVLTVFEPNISRYPMADGLFRGPSGEVIPVVHQYDRSPSLEAALLKRLSLD
ncbi:MAG TPA: hypothetical protein VK508_03650 [Cyclobacteriaceae bacterium]|nr:hypothetical protein [Cyclobacteriaceae bacterium]